MRTWEKPLISFGFLEEEEFKVTLDYTKFSSVILIMISLFFSLFPFPNLLSK